MSRRAALHRVVAFAGVLLLSSSAGADGSEWFTAWTRSQGPGLLDTTTTFADQTVRVGSRVYVGGSAVRVRVQNAFGKSTDPAGTLPLTVQRASVAIRASGASVVPGSLRALTFGGVSSVTVAPGQFVVSDPVWLEVAPGQDVVSSFYVISGVPAEHVSDTVTQFLTPAGSGDHVWDVEGTSFTTRAPRAYLAVAVDLLTKKIDGTIVATGGSVVDGSGSTRDGYNTWPDVLGQRMLAERPEPRRKAVVNAGIGGTTAASACSVSTFGPSVQARLQRDTLSLSGVSHVVVYAGTNDLAFGCTGDDIIASYKDIAAQAHAAGVSVVISTVTPRRSYTAQQNVYREQVNAWVRAGGNCSGFCEASIDFDAVIRDPADPNRIDPALDSGDGIHPNPAGYALMAHSIPLAIFD